MCVCVHRHSKKVNMEKHSTFAVFSEVSVVEGVEECASVYLAWQDETLIPGSQCYKGNTVELFMPNRVHLRSTVQGYFRKRVHTDYL